MASEATVSVLVGKLNDLLNQEAQYLHDFQRIASLFSHLGSFLKDANERQKEDERAGTFVAEITDVSYDVEDVIDTIILNERAKIEQMRSGFVGRVKRYKFIFNEMKAHRKVGKEIQQINLRMIDISNSSQTYGIREFNYARKEGSSSWIRNLHEQRRTFALFQESDVVGLQEDTEALKELLINGEPRCCVVSIVGMAGSGQTTLAKKVHHDVKRHFDCHAFIYLSQQYKIGDIYKYIIKCVMSQSPEKIKNLLDRDDRDVAIMLRRHFSGKRYLVVIDDIWTLEQWDVLKLTLPDDLNKGRVLLTTRNKNVA